MPDVVIRRELYQTFGSRSEYLAVPLWEAVEERCRIEAEFRVRGAEDAELSAKIAEQEAEAERIANGGR